MKITVIIPCYHLHFNKINRVLDCHYKNTRKPDQVIISLNGCSNLRKEDISVLQKKYKQHFTDFLIIETQTLLNRARARNICIPYITGDIVCFSDADDEEHLQRFEIVEYFFKNHDIVHLLHSYILIKCFRYMCGGCVLCKRENYNNNFIQYGNLENIKYCEPSILYDINYPSENIKPNVKNILGIVNGEQIMPVHGLVCVKKEVFDKIKFNENYPRGQDSLFSQEVLKEFKKTILIESQLHIYDNGWIPKEDEFNKFILNNGKEILINLGSKNPPKPGTPITSSEILEIVNSIKSIINY